MKKVYKTVIGFLFLVLPLISFSQINVTIVGPCAALTETYNYLDLFNGKNRYSKDFVIQGNALTFQVRFDGTNWILWADSNPTEDGFRNTALSSNLTPPLTGWFPVGCSTGTMIITQALSAANYDLLPNLIFNNPVENYLDLKLNNTDLQFEKVEIYNLLGKIIKSEQYSDENIDVSNLESGIYILKITDFNNKIYSAKLIKK